MIKITQPWQKRLEASDRPAYLLLADLIAEDIRTGRLTARDKLPTLRDLAAELRLNYTTVARGYAEARKRGLIDSHTGMGTYVRGASPAIQLRGGSGAEMTMNMPPEPEDANLLAGLRDKRLAFSPSVARLDAAAIWQTIVTTAGEPAPTAP